MLIAYIDKYNRGVEKTLIVKINSKLNNNSRFHCAYHSSTIEIPRQTRICVVSFVKKCKTKPSKERIAIKFIQCARFLHARTFKRWIATITLKVHFIIAFFLCTTPSFFLFLFFVMFIANHAQRYSRRRAWNSSNAERRQWQVAVSQPIWSSNSSRARHIIKILYTIREFNRRRSWRMVKCDQSKKISHSRVWPTLNVVHMLRV